jgi:TRAP-type C4-dicarboxylate transport system substrate-binding protein
MAAVIDYMVTCADCQKEFADKGLVYVNNASTWPSQVHTTKKAVRTLADLKGLRLRSAGGYTTTWLEFMGAVPVEVTFNEEYEALQTGLVEGSAVPRDNVFGNRLYEMVRFSTPVNIGTFHALANFTTRQQTWAGFSPKLREAYIKAALLGALGYTTASKGVGEKAMDEMKARGGVIVEPSQELLDENEKFRAKVLETAIELGTSRYKLNDPDGKAKRFAALVKHWTPIIEPIQGDVDAVAKAIWDGVWAKVDLATYGG